MLRNKTRINSRASPRLDAKRKLSTAQAKLMNPTSKRSLNTSNKRLSRVVKVSSQYKSNRSPSFSQPLYFGSSRSFSTDKQTQSSQSSTGVTKSDTSPSNPTNDKTTSHITQAPPPPPPSSSSSSSSSTPPNTPILVRPRSTPYNLAISTTNIPDLGYKLYESSQRPRLKAISLLGLTLPLTTGGIVSLISQTQDLSQIGPVIPLSIIFGLLGVYGGCKVSQGFVDSIYLQRDNTLRFESSGIFNFKRVMVYPANYIYPIAMDARVGILGFDISLLPLPEDMIKTPGTWNGIKPSGMWIYPNTNTLTGMPNDTFQQLLFKNETFDILQQRPKMTKSQVRAFSE